MTRTEKRRAQERQRSRRRMQITAWAILIICELLVASIQAALTAKVLVPLGRAARGYEVFGVEWLVVAVVFCIAYALAHKYACDRIFEEGERK